MTKFQGWLALALLGLIATALWYPLVGENVFIGAAILLGAAFVATFTVKFFKAEK